MKVGGELRERLATAGLDASDVMELAERGLAEDLDGGVDVTSVATVEFDAVGEATFVARAGGVVAGLPVSAVVLQAASDDALVLDFLVDDGARIDPGQPLLRVTGRLRALLTAERTSLNLLCHLSGVATLTRMWVDAVAGTGAQIRDTRKTTPGLRTLDKYAVRCGGGVNHRRSLSDAALVKDNHVVAAGGVAAAYDAVRDAFPDVAVEVECDTLAQVREAVAAGADLILCDNMGLADLRSAVEMARGAGVRTEASGGLTLDLAHVVAATGVDFLAVGALTHSAPALDIGFDLAASRVARRR